MRIIFMGTPDFSVPALDALVTAGHEVIAVYCQPPRPAGRGNKERPSSVQSFAEGQGLSVHHPLNFQDQQEINNFKNLNADIAVVVAYGLILPKAILDAPKLGCLNIHASLLPRWRGAAPIHRAIMAGDEKTGISIMQMDVGLDTGPVLNQAQETIQHTDTTATLHDRLSKIGAELIVDTIKNLSFLKARPQPQQGVSYAKKIDKAEAKIDWSQPADVVDRKIKGLSPFPGAWCIMNGQRVKILHSTVVDVVGHVGLVTDDALTIACGQAAIQPISLQRSGGKAMGVKDFLRGFDVPKGSVVS